LPSTAFPLRILRLALVNNPESLRPALWSTAAFAGGVLLHVDRVPWWASAVLAICAAWQIHALARGRSLPSLPVRVLLAFVLVAGVLAVFHTLNGLVAGTVLLVLMGSIKLLETRSRRDRYIVIGAALFLLLAACLDRQMLARAPLYLAETALCCTALAVAAYGGAGLPARVAAMLALRTLLLALPLALVLFFFFPRLPGGFWALPGNDDAVTGLSDSMSPGSISELTSSYDPVFRVHFTGAIPPPQERYWRGPVLHDFDGYTWQHTHGEAYRRQPLQYLGTPYRYSVTLVPDSNRWWFALDTVTGSPDKRVVFTYDYNLIATEPVTQTTTYEALSYTHTESAEPLSAVAHRRETALPQDRNPRTAELAASLRAQNASDAEFVRAVVTLFRSGGFEYTLTPPKLDRDSVDDFLFHTRKGFCGHFASAFVALMRAGGIPARVVTGYQGGEWNPVGDYFVIRQSDAHAWAEIWAAGRGWRRIDPTGIVAPERLRRGILDLLPDAIPSRSRIMHAAPWLTHLLQTWDALNTAWNERVVNFDVNAQFRILERLGLGAANWTALIAALGSGLIGWLIWIAWHVSRSAAPQSRDQLARAYMRLCAKLARAGIERAPSEGPLDYAARIGGDRPDLALRAQPLLARYAQLRYGPGSGVAAATAVTAFERMVLRCYLTRRG
jgi:transglutaminase-like putative cysteine protease